MTSLSHTYMLFINESLCYPNLWKTTSEFNDNLNSVEVEMRFFVHTSISYSNGLNYTSSVWYFNENYSRRRIVKDHNDKSCKIPQNVSIETMLKLIEVRGRRLQIRKNFRHYIIHMEWFKYYFKFYWGEWEGVTHWEK